MKESTSVLKIERRRYIADCVRKYGFVSVKAVEDHMLTTFPENPFHRSSVEADLVAFKSIGNRLVKCKGIIFDGDTPNLAGRDHRKMQCKEQKSGIGKVGASLVTSTDIDAFFEDLKQTNHALIETNGFSEKWSNFVANIKSISNFRTSFLKVAVGSGTTSEALVRQLESSIAFDSDDQQRVEIITNNLNVWTIVSRIPLAVTVIGGYQQRGDDATSGDSALKCLEACGAVPELSFFSTVSVDLETQSVHCGKDSDVSVKRWLLAKTKKFKCLLADSSKFKAGESGRRGWGRETVFAGLDELDLIITDSQLSDDVVSVIHGAGVFVCRVAV